MLNSDIFKKVFGIHAIDLWGMGDRDLLKWLNSVYKPQRTGRWILDENDFLTKCSECGCHPWFGVIPTPKEATKKLPHCPMCLVKMEENTE